MNLLPFDSVATCPKCGQPTRGYRVEYSTALKTLAGEGRFVPMSTYGDPLVPHLEKHCPHCGYGWLEETKDANDDA